LLLAQFAHEHESQMLVNLDRMNFEEFRTQMTPWMSHKTTERASLLEVAQHIY
jgi:hypothetical protein